MECGFAVVDDEDFCFIEVFFPFTAVILKIF